MQPLMAIGAPVRLSGRFPGERPLTAEARRVAEMATSAQVGIAAGVATQRTAEWTAAEATPPSRSESAGQTWRNLAFHGDLMDLEQAAEDHEQRRITDYTALSAVKPRSTIGTPETDRVRQSTAERIAEERSSMARKAAERKWAEQNLTKRRSRPSSSRRSSGLRESEVETGPRGPRSRAAEGSLVTASGPSRQSGSEQRSRPKSASAYWRHSLAKSSAQLTATSDASPIERASEPRSARSVSRASAHQSESRSVVDGSIVSDVVKGSSYATSACTTDMTGSYVNSISEYSSVATSDTSNGSAPWPCVPQRVRRPKSAGAAFGAVARKGNSALGWCVAETIPENTDDGAKGKDRAERPSPGDTPYTTCVGNWGRRNVEGGPDGLRHPTNMSTPRKHWTMMSGTWPSDQRTLDAHKYRRWGENWAIAR